MIPASEALDRTFRALAHPLRRAMLTRLARDGSASISELAEPFEVSLMAISKHVKVMEGAGLVRRERDGRIQRCTFDPTPMESARGWIDRHRDFWDAQLDAVTRYLESPGLEEEGS